jgi:uncharacterized lipoprotein YddW (UPF0748 family)
MPTAKCIKALHTRLQEVERERDSLHSQLAEAQRAYQHAEWWRSDAGIEWWLDPANPVDSPTV